MSNRSLCEQYDFDSAAMQEETENTMLTHTMRRKLPMIAPWQGGVAHLNDR